MSVRERPILMSAPMAVACMRQVNPKSQTRRIIKPQHSCYDLEKVEYGTAYWRLIGKPPLIPDPVGSGKRVRALWIPYCSTKCPYGKIGDKLWVRETWYSLDGTSKPDGLAFRADGEVPYIKWRSPIFMPRWASRITLEITELRVERLQDISDEDCIAEGIGYIPQLGIMRACGWQDYSGKTAGFLYPKDSYRSLWESINGSGSWDLNPFCWCVSFKRVV